ncbi:hypothetical protein M6B38_144955 [Iris pallida]|uniref:Uncharacterized protein n=1 Tax=Iris pallida TaxID=29817 RepID=A0AAX6FAQ9_IRIPA|nr:hypothetical protein M6B38_144955 [Iris pallida]
MTTSAGGLISAEPHRSWRVAADDGDGEIAMTTTIAAATPTVAPSPAI